MTSNENDFDDDLLDEGPSKSQLKRDAHSFVELGQRLMDIPQDQLYQIELPDVVDAVLDAKRIRKGNARKRQLQYIGKLLRKSELTALQQVLNRYDASSDEHASQFHQLENWRERLIGNDAQALNEIIAAHPNVDRQHLRTLTRNAIQEREKEKQPPVHFRKLFQYLKSLLDH